MDTHFTWIPFYMELADKLRAYADDRSALIQKVIALFEHMDIKLPTLESAGAEITDIDPFTVFGLFNKSFNQRSAVLKGMAEEFGVQAPIPVDFDAIPVLNPMQSLFYSFDRGERDIDNLWELFSAALDYADHHDGRERFCSLFNTVIRQWCVGLAKLTMGLFWVRPHMFVNLDGTNQNYLLASPDTPPQVASFIRQNMVKKKNFNKQLDGAVYLSFCDLFQDAIQQDELPYQDFPAFSFCAWKYRKSHDEEEWFPSPEEYTPGLSVEDWRNLLADTEVFDEKSLFVVQCMYDIGGQATCKELSNRYGREVNFYNSVSSSLAQRIHKKTDCPVMNRGDIENSRFWPILYIGKKADKDQPGAWVWKLRDELREALELMERDTIDTAGPHYWIYAPGRNASMWDECYNNGIMAIGWDEIGDFRSYHSKEEMKQRMKETIDPNRSFINDAHATWQFVNDMRPGDIVFAKKGKLLIIGCGIVESDYIFDANRRLYKSIRKVKWTHTGEWQHPGQAVLKTLTDITDYTEYVLQLKELIGLNDIIMTKDLFKPYSKSDFLHDVFLTEPEYDKLRSLVLRKKNIILQGAPGVGKTFSAKRLAYSIIGEKNDSRICMVQFHQNYSYEDFIMGYRPNDNGGFELQSGVFFNFCEKCKEHPGEDYFFIIDEINRGNLSKIFGELLMLIETDKRGKEHPLKLVYGGKPFYIPDNLHIIGMMNTADRSLAMIDYALRRRFSFYTMQPAFENADQNGFGDYMADIQCELYHSVIAKIRELNHAIRHDSTLGKGFEIGHSYFAPENKSDIDDEWVRGVVEYEIIPLIEEYWFDDDKKADEWTKALYQVIGD